MMKTGANLLFPGLELGLFLAVPASSRLVTTFGSRCIEVPDSSDILTGNLPTPAASFIHYPNVPSTPITDPTPEARQMRGSESRCPPQRGASSSKSLQRADDNVTRLVHRQSSTK